MSDAELRAIWQRFFAKPAFRRGGTPALLVASTTAPPPVTGGPIQAPPGQSGEGAQGSSTLNTQIGGYGLGTTFSVVHETFVESCPDRQGRVSGHARVLFGSGEQRTAPNGDQYTLDWKMEATGQITGHVNDNAHLTDYDLVIVETFRVDVQGKHGGHVTHIPPAVYTVRLVFSHVVPGSVDPVRTSALQSVSSSRALNAVAAQFVDALVAMIRGSTEPTLEIAERVHWGSGECLRADFKPGSLNDLRGGHGPVQVTVVSTRYSTPVDIKLTAGGHDTQFSPSQAETTRGAPVTFMVTVKNKSTGLTWFGVDGESRMGVVRGSIDLQRGPLALVDKATSTANLSYAYDQSSGPAVNRGTYSEQRNVALSSQVPLPVVPPGTPASGSAPLTWGASSSWSTDDVNTSTSQSSQLCTIDFNDTLTSVTPGTVQVKSLTVSNPTMYNVPRIALDVIVSGAVEHWHNNETTTAGPCPAFSSDPTSNILLQELAAVHGAHGDTIQQVGNGYELHINSGWRLGVGNVVATRTITGTLPPPRPGSSAPIYFTDTFQVIHAPK